MDHQTATVSAFLSRIDRAVGGIFFHVQLNCDKRFFRCCQSPWRLHSVCFFFPSLPYPSTLLALAVRKLSSKKIVLSMHSTPKLSFFWKLWRDRSNSFDISIDCSIFFHGGHHSSACINRIWRSERRSWSSLAAAFSGWLSASRTTNWSRNGSCGVISLTFRKFALSLRAHAKKLSLRDSAS